MTVQSHLACLARQSKKKQDKGKKEKQSTKYYYYYSLGKAKQKTKKDKSKMKKCQLLVYNQGPKVFNTSEPRGQLGQRRSRQTRTGNGASPADTHY